MLHTEVEGLGADGLGADGLDCCTMGTEDGVGATGVDSDVEDEEAPLPPQVESMKQPNPSGQLEAV